MARKVTTEYICDGCGNHVERARDLVRFAIGPTRTDVEVTPDLCADCEKLLLSELARFVPDEQKVALLDMHRVV